MRQRDARVGRHRDGRRDAGHHLEGNARALERQGLLAAATEHERVAALEPHDPPAASRVGHEERGDPLLRQRVAARGLAGEDAAGPGRLVEQAGVHQAVIDDDVGAPQEVEAAHRDEPGVARAGADERYRAYAHTVTPRSSSRRRLAASRPCSTMSPRTSGPSARRQAVASAARPAARSSRRASAAIWASVA